MARKRKPITKKKRLIDNARKMPPLYHTLPGEEFDIMKSEVMKWMMDQPTLRSAFFNMIISPGSADSPIKYDPDTGKWCGVDYED